MDQVEPSVEGESSRRFLIIMVFSIRWSEVRAFGQGPKFIGRGLERIQ